MIAGIDALARLTSGKAEADGIADEAQLAAASMFLIVIGEGARLLSEDLKAEAPETPWNDMVGLRNRLAHGYFHASPRVVWRTASDHAQALRPVLVRLLALLGPEPD